MKKQKKVDWKSLLKIILIACGIFVLEQLTDIKFTLVDFLKIIGIGLLGGLSPLLIILSVLGSFRLFRKFYPAQEEVPVEINLQGASKYNNYYLVSTGLMFLGWPIGGVVTYHLLVWLSEKWFGLFNGVYIAPFEKAFWIGPSLFIGILFGALFSTILLKIFIRDDYANYVSYFNKNWGFNTNKASKIVVYAYFILIFALIYVGLSSYARFTEEGIYIHNSYQLAEEYHSYDEVVKIEEIVRKGKRSSDHIFLIQFSDGRMWRTTSLKDNAIPENFPLIMNYVAQKTGKNYNQLNLDD